MDHQVESIDVPMVILQYCILPVIYRFHYIANPDASTNAGDLGPSILELFKGHDVFYFLDTVLFDRIVQIQRL